MPHLLRRLKYSSRDSRQNGPQLIHFVDQLWVLMWQKTARPEAESRGECIEGGRKSGAGLREALAED